MTEAEKNRRPSLFHFIEKTAQFLRAKAKDIEKRTFQKLPKGSLSITNKIEQIASLIRSQVKKPNKSKKKKD